MNLDLCNISTRNIEIPLTSIADPRRSLDSMRFSTVFHLQPTKDDTILLHFFLVFRSVNNPSQSSEIWAPNSPFNTTSFLSLGSDQSLLETSSLIPDKSASRMPAVRETTIFTEHTLIHVAVILCRLLCPHAPIAVATPTA